MTDQPNAPARGRSEGRAERLDMAGEYAQRGMLVLPLHEPAGDDARACTCPKGASCKEPARHASTPAGLADATIDPAKLRAWWDAGHPANVGLVVGHEWSFIALDVNAEEDGLRALDLMTNAGPLPETVEAHHPNGSRVYFFRHPRVHLKRVVPLGPGVRVLAEGSVVPAPPSLAIGGGALAWAPGRRPGEVGMADAPLWLVESLRPSPAGKSKPAEQGIIPEWDRTNALTHTARELRAEGQSADTILSLLLNINKTRCKPPLEEAVVRSIAKAEAPPREADRLFADEYVENNGCIAILRSIKTSSGWVQQPENLCNFTARILEQLIRDNGREKSIVYLIEGKHKNGRALGTVRVPSTLFESMSWIEEHWGADVNKRAGQSTKSHLATAMRALSPQPPRRLVYEHTGWKRIGGDDGEWHYLHAGGAIGANGTLPGIEVDLESTLKDIRLPDPPEPRSAELSNAVRASLKLLDLAETPSMGAVVIGSAYRAMLYEVEPPGYGVWIEGLSGSFKSEVASLAMSHYGSAWRGNHLPAEWKSTGNAIEKLAFLAKDAIFVVDDYVPRGTHVEKMQREGQVDNLFRGGANQSSRKRMWHDGKLRESYVPRSLTLSTGEDVPDIGSMKARALIVSLERGEIPDERLALAQLDAANGLYALAMSGFARWLAPRIDMLRASFAENVNRLRSKVNASNAHKRIPTSIAQLFAGWMTFLDYATEDALLSKDEADKILDRVWDALLSTLSVQVTLSSEDSPAKRFLSLIGGELDAGHCHIATRNGGPPPNPEGWGWQPAGGQRALDDAAAPAWLPKGPCVGVFLDDMPGVVGLFPETAFTTAREAARHQGNDFGFGQQTLWRRMKEAGRLAAFERGRLSNKIRRNVRGKERPLVAVRADEFGGEAPDQTQWKLSAFETPGFQHGNAPDAPPDSVAAGARERERGARDVLLQVADELAEKAGAAENWSRADALALATDRGVEYDEATRALAQLALEGVVEQVSESAYRKRKVTWS